MLLLLLILSALYPLIMNASPSSRKSSSADLICSSKPELEIKDDSKALSAGFQLQRGYSHQSFNIVGVLGELKDDIVDCNPVCNTTGISREIAKKSPTGMGDVYVEKNGRFVKASKEILELCEFNSKEVYLEETRGAGLATPLDLAILVEKGCSAVSRMLLGVLSGVALLALILITILLDVKDMKQMASSWYFFVTITDVCQTLFFVVLTICLVSMLDWLDLAHCNLQHLSDTIQWRKIFFVLIIYFSAMVVFLFMAPSNDSVIYSMVISHSNITQPLDKEGGVILDHNHWKTLTSGYLALCFIGWFFVILSRNEDLFYLNLIEMKKYEACN